MSAVLVVRGLDVRFTGRHRQVHAVRGIDLTVQPGEAVAIVGESGSGKSVTARALVGLAGSGAEVRAEELRIAGVDARRLSDSGWRGLRGRRVGLVMQDALGALDTLRTVRQEVGEGLHAHRLGRRREINERVLETLRLVGFPDPEVRGAQFPHQLSGGLRQRALIASAIAADPDLIVADEPTTALDVTVQAQILDLLAERRDAGTALILISHDLAVVSKVADRVMVMKDGEVVEEGETTRVLTSPSHEYTKLLLRAVPSAATRGQRLSDSPSDWPQSPPTVSPVIPETGFSPVGQKTGHFVPENTDFQPISPQRGRKRRVFGDVTPADAPLDGGTDADMDWDDNQSGFSPVMVAEGIVKEFSLPGKKTLKALDGVDLTVYPSQKLGIVGESGSGKSTLARILLGLVRPDAGQVRVLGTPWGTGAPAERRRTRHTVQFVSQDPLGSFDPRYTVEEVLSEPLRGVLSPADRRARVREVMDLARIESALLSAHPRSLSGGQRQRVSIARALALRPEVLICDEPVSALDVSIQAQILDLLFDLNARTGTCLVFISHDLGVVHHIVDDVVVMQEGRVVESGPVDEVFAYPREAYTRLLLDAVPRLRTHPIPPPETGPGSRTGTSRVAVI